MKKILILLLLAWVACLQADVYLDDTYYMQCSGCSNDGDFINKARLHFENNYPYSEDIPISGIHKNYVLVNSVINRVKTVRVSWQSRVINGPRGRQRGTETVMSAVVRPNSLYTEEAYSMFLNNNQKFEDMYVFDPYLGFTESITGTWNKLYLGKTNVDWSGNGSFYEQASTLIEARLGLSYINPFHFVNTPLAVELESNDDYFVVMIADTNLDESRTWQVFYIKDDNAYLDESGNQLNLLNLVNANHLCLATGYGETCRAVDSDNQAYGGIFARAVAEVIYSDGCKINCPPPTGGCPAGSTTCQAGNGSEP